MNGFAVHSLGELDPWMDGDEVPRTRRRLSVYLGKIKSAAIHEESS